MRAMATCRYPPRRLPRGVAAVELALLSTLLVAFVLGVSQFGQAMFQYDTLVKSARVGARYLSQYPAGDATAISNAKCLVVYGRISPCSGTPQVPNFSTSMVTVSDAFAPGGTSYKDVATTQGKVNLVELRVVGLSFQISTPFLTASYPFGAIKATMTQGSL